MGWSRRASGPSTGGLFSGPVVLLDEMACRQDDAVADLYEQIGRLQMELGWMKKQAAEFA